MSADARKPVSVARDIPPVAGEPSRAPASSSRFAASMPGEARTSGRVARSPSRVDRGPSPVAAQPSRRAPSLARPAREPPRVVRAPARVAASPAPVAAQRPCSVDARAANHRDWHDEGSPERVRGFRARGVGLGRMWGRAPAASASAAGHGGCYGSSSPRRLQCADHVQRQRLYASDRGCALGHRERVGSVDVQGGLAGHRRSERAPRCDAQGSC